MFAETKTPVLIPLHVQSPFGCVLLVAAAMLSGCAQQRASRSWDNIDYQSAARSRVYQDNDSSYTLPTVYSCNGPDDDVYNPRCK